MDNPQCVLWPFGSGIAQRTVYPVKDSGVLDVPYMKQASTDLSKETVRLLDQLYSLMLAADLDVGQLEEHVGVNSPPEELRCCLCGRSVASGSCHGHFLTISCFVMYGVLRCTDRHQLHIKSLMIHLDKLYTLRHELILSQVRSH